MTDTTSAPLCWGQRWAWHEQQLPFGQRSPSIHLTQTMLLPDDVGAGAIRDALNRVTTRHTSLRSTFAVGADGTPQQHVWPVEEHRYDFGEQRPGEEESGKAWLDSDIDISHRWPLRVGVARTPTGATAVALVIHHIAVDRYALERVSHEVRETAIALARGVEPSALPTGRQPFEIAAFEQSPAGRGVNERAIAYWLRHDAELDAVLSTLRRRFDQPSGSMYVARAVSRAAVERLPALAAVAGGSEAAVVTAAVAWVLAEHLDRRSIPISMMVPNRHRPGYGDSIASLAQGGLASVDVSDPRDFVAVVRRSWSATLSAMRHGYYDGDELSERMTAFESGGRHTTVAPPSINVMHADGTVGTPDLEWYSGDRPYETRVELVGRPCLGLNFHAVRASSHLLVELRVGTHLVSEQESRTLVSEAMRLILGQR